MLRIKRNTGFSGILGRIKIYVNDQKVAMIKQNQQIELELPTDEAKIYVSQVGTHSNELVVKDSQVVEITNSSWLHINSIFTFIAIFSISAFLPHNYKIIGYLILLVISIILTYFKNGFELKIIYP